MKSERRKNSSRHHLSTEPGTQPITTRTKLENLNNAKKNITKCTDCKSVPKKHKAILNTNIRSKLKKKSTNLNETTKMS